MKRSELRPIFKKWYVVPFYPVIALLIIIAAPLLIACQSFDFKWFYSDIKDSYCMAFRFMRFNFDKEDKE